MNVKDKLEKLRTIVQMLKIIQWYSRAQPDDKFEIFECRKLMVPEIPHAEISHSEEYLNHKGIHAVDALPDLYNYPFKT